MRVSRSRLLAASLAALLSCGAAQAVTGPGSVTVSGTVIGLDGTLKLSKEVGIPSIVVKGNGTGPVPFTFNTPIAVGSNYHVTINQQPAGETCIVVNGDGVVTTAGSPNLSVYCAITGPAGPQGPQGVAGPVGATGPTGPQGVAGPQGASGPVGPMGFGATGATGPQGPAGPAGPVGQNGAIGPAGPQGPQGPQGLQGQPGSPGMTGPAGPSGASGDTVHYGNNVGSQALGTGAQCTIGQVLLFAGSVGTGLPADGRLIPIQSNIALYSVMGVDYGGDGSTTFGLPDLRPITPNNMTYFICSSGVFPARL